MINSKRKINLALIILCLLFAIFIRAYNIGYDNLWFDEISSYWVSDPRITFQESIERHEKIEKTPYLYFLLLKINFNLFSYDAVTGRYLSLIFNILGIIFSSLICKSLKNNNSYILALSIFSMNIFLINYSQELRVYSMTFFLCSLYLFLFLKIHNFYEKKKINILYLILISSILVLLLISHPFCYIVFFSTSLFLGLRFVKKKINSLTLLYNFYFGSFFLIIYLFFTIDNISNSPSWINQPDLKFFTNFYFSKFFGSRIMGLVHLILIIVLSLNYFIMKKKEEENFELYLFLIIIFLSYSIPLVYGYVFKPIIFPRYIIFVLIPIIILLSILIFEIKHPLIRNIVIFIIIILNFGNHFTEASFKQFYSKRPFYKPNFNEMLNVINNDETKLYTINLSSSQNQYDYEAIQNYISNFEIYKKSDIEYLNKEDFIKSDIKKIWIICLINIDENKCDKVLLRSEDRILSKKNVPGIKVVLTGNLS